MPTLSQEAVDTVYIHFMEIIIVIIFKISCFYTPGPSSLNAINRDEVSSSKIRRGNLEAKDRARLTGDNRR